MKMLAILIAALHSMGDVSKTKAHPLLFLSKIVVLLFFVYATIFPVIR